MMIFKKALAPEEKGFVTINGEAVAFSLTRTKKRKRSIAFRMEADASLRVTAPRTASLGAVIKILLSRAPWISKHLKIHRDMPHCDFTEGSSIVYMGHTLSLRVTRGAGDPACYLYPRILRVHVPDEKLSNEGLRAEIKTEITLWVKKRARLKLRHRLDLWSERMNLPYKKFVVADAERRWGSCSADDVIRLNWRLMLAPLALIDYVVVHELAHVAHKDHSPHFWACVEAAMPDWRQKRAALRRIENQLAI